MAQVLLISGAGSGKKRYGKLEKVGAYSPTYGLLSVAAVLERAGHRVRVIDREVPPITNEEIVSVIERERPDVVGLSVFTIALAENIELAKAIKKRCGVPVVVGGPQVIVDADRLKQDACFDYMVQGEGEETIVELMGALENGRRVESIPGVIHRPNGEWSHGGPREFINDLDQLPFPAFHLLGDLRRYHPTPFGYRRLPHVPLVTSRGCPFKCIFCNNIWGHKWRAHSAGYVLGLVKYVVERFGVREVWFVEDTFALNRQRVVDICEGILSSGLDIVWSCMTNIHVMDRELVRLMRRAGCWQVQLGLESGNDEVLKFVRKPVTTDLIREKVTMIDEEGIKVRGYFILGHLIDTRETIEQTINFALSLPLYTAEFHVMVLSLGSEARQIAHEYGKVNYDVSVLTAYPDSGLSFVPRGLTEKEMFEFERRGHNRFFLRPKVIAKFLADIRSWTDLKRYSLMGQAFLANVR